MSQVKRNIKHLELHRETIQDLTEADAEGVAGGLVACGSHHVCPTKGCPTKVNCPKDTDWCPVKAA